MRRLWAGITAAILVAGPVPLVALDRSPHPTPRASESRDAPQIVVRTRSAQAVSPTPRPRVSKPAQAPQTASVARLQVSPHPAPRGNLRPQKARVMITRPPGDPSKIGQVCGSSKIRGRQIPRVPGALPGCGVSNPVQVVSVSGVRLSTAATMTCETAKALSSWIDKGAKKAVGRTGGGLVELRVAAHYSCRTRNNRPGAKISEHGRGKAIDISAFVLKDGTVISLLKGWNDRKQGKILRQMHKAACGPFGTVLGPESDRYHKDHFHFDVASYRSGPYCR